MSDVFLEYREGIAWVYVFYNPTTNLYKIGISNQVKKRLKSIVANSGCHIEILYLGICKSYCDWKANSDAKSAEKRIHDRLIEYKIKINNQRTEWFNLPLHKAKHLSCIIRSSGTDWVWVNDSFDYSMINQ